MSKNKRSSFNKNKPIFTNKVKFTLTFLAIIMLSIALIFAFVKIDKNETRKNVDGNVFTYSIGILNEEGKSTQGTSSIYTKDFYSVDGLKVDLKDNASVTYKICFYNADKVLVSSLDSLETDYELPESTASDYPTDAKYFKVQITPTNDAEVSFFEISTYANQLSISINK